MAILQPDVVKAANIHSTIITFHHLNLLANNPR